MHWPHQQHADDQKQKDRHKTYRQTERRNGHTVETGHDGGLTAITSIVIWTPDGGKTYPQREKEETIGV